MENFIVRLAQLADVGHVQQLMLRAFQFERDHGFDSDLDMHWPLSEAAQANLRSLIEQEG